MKHSGLLKVLSVLCIVISLLFCCAEAEGLKGTIMATSLNVREKPDENAVILSSIPKNTVVTVLSMTGDFYRISFGTVTGYVSADYISVSGDTSPTGKEGVTTCGNVNMRAGCSASYDIIRVLPENAKVQILGTENGFYKVDHNGSTGYISDKYIEVIFADDETPVPAQDKKGFININNVNMRKEASTSSTILYQLQYGTEVTIIGNENGFYKVKYNGATGYIATDYVSPASRQTSKPVSTPKASPTGTPKAAATSSTKITNCDFTGYVNVNSVNMREEPSSSSPIMYQISKDTSVKVTGITGEFYRVKYNGHTGYIMSAYISKENTPAATPAKTAPTSTPKVSSASGTGYVTSDTLNMRQGAGKQYDIILILHKNDQVAITGESGDYYQVKAGGKTGFVAKAYITQTKPSSTVKTAEPTAKSTTSADTVSYKATGIVNAVSVNMRENPSVSSGLIARIPDKTQLNITGISGDFYKISYNGKTGYVAKAYVSIIENTLGKTATPKPEKTSSPKPAATVKIETMNETGHVNSGTLNVREAPSSAAAVIGQLKVNASVKITGSTGDYYRISYNGSTGYVMKSYVSLASSSKKITAAPTASKTQAPVSEFKAVNQPGTVTADQVNLREKPSTSSACLVQFSKGTAVTVLAQNDTFYKIKYKSTTGYIVKSYVKLGSSATEKPSSTQAPSNASSSSFTSFKANGIITSNGVNLRKSASTDSASLCRLDVNTNVSITAQNNEFYKVTYNGKTGYIVKQYVKISTATAKPSSTAAPSASRSQYANCTSISQLGDAPGYLSYGNSGTDVEKLQQALKIKGYYTGSVDGKYGLSTKDAVLSYQKKNGLPQTGKADYATIKKLFGKVSVTTVEDDPKMNGITHVSQIVVPATSKKGDSGKDVLALQQALKIKGFYKAPIDSRYGETTYNAVIAYQKSRGMKQTGEADYSTIKSIFGSNAADYKYVTEQLYWFHGGEDVIPRGAVFTVKDVATGLTYRAKRWSGANHMDCEPLTAEDTAIMKRIYGGSWSWTRHAILVMYKGHVYAGSQNAMPHGTSTISNNNFDGHYCIHFTGSKTHGSQKVDPDHQAAIKRALKATW
ncbi:MAG: hypothetical protein CW338_01835 [Clostridiales bacterium]|nr:hypothetical protein [Clostridiales bacterium]